MRDQEKLGQYAHPFRAGDHEYLTEDTRLKRVKRVDRIMCLTAALCIVSILALLRFGHV